MSAHRGRALARTRREEDLYKRTYRTHEYKYTRTHAAYTVCVRNVISRIIEGPSTLRVCFRRI